MPDLVDYILNASPELVHHPHWADLEAELRIDVLGYADDCLRSFRERDRLADAMADERWSSWTGILVAREELRPGQRVIVMEGYIPRQAIVTPTQVGTHQSAYDPLVIFVTVPEFPYRPVRRVPSKAEILRWVPIPIDGATLGAHPSTPQVA